MWRIEPNTECRGCGRIMSSSKARAEHESRRHPYLHWFRCPLCVAPSHFRTPSSTSLVHHITQLHLPVQCTKCGERLETAVDLQRHAALTLQPAPPHISLPREKGMLAADMQATPQGRVRFMKRSHFYNQQLLLVENRKTSLDISSFQEPISPQAETRRSILKRRLNTSLAGDKLDSQNVLCDADDKTPKSLTVFDKENLVSEAAVENSWIHAPKLQMNATPLRADDDSPGQTDAATPCSDNIPIISPIVNVSEETAMMTAHSKWDSTFFEMQCSVPSENKVSSTGSVTGILRRVGSGGSDPLKRVRFAKGTPNLDTTPLRGVSPLEGSAARVNETFSSPRIEEEDDAMMTAQSNWDIASSLFGLTVNPLPELDNSETTNNESELMTTASSSFQK